MRAVILTGGKIYDGFEFSAKEGDYIICADSGARHAERLGITPDVLVGDFDSICSVPEGIPRITFQKEKDETDTQLAIQHALGIGYKDIFILGALGGRADHSVANIFLLKHIADSGAGGCIEDGKNRIILTKAPVSIKKEEGRFVSIFPMFGDVKGVTLSGMKYPLLNYYMKEGDVVGISNEITGEEGHVFFKSGYLLIMMCSDFPIL